MPEHASRMSPMIDVLYVAGTILFFALMLLYVEGCERLGRVADVERAPRRTRDDDRELDRRRPRRRRFSSTSSTRCFVRRSSDETIMTVNGWLQILFFCALRARSSRSRSGSTSCASTTDRYAGSRRSSARSIASCGVDPDEDQHWTRYAARHAAVQRRVDAAHLRRAAPPARAAAQPAASRRR